MLIEQTIEHLLCTRPHVLSVIRGMELQKEYFLTRILVQSDPQKLFLFNAAPKEYDPHPGYIRRWKRETVGLRSWIVIRLLAAAPFGNEG